jgi:hypothetical protein
MTARISQREYARLRGISHTAVQRAIKAGRITAVKGKIDPEEADRLWQQNTDQSKPLNRITGNPKQKGTPGEPPEPMDLGGSETISGPSSASGYAKARAARELYQAQLAKLELDRRRGELVSADEVRLAAFQLARKTRDQLLALPERVASILAAVDDPDQVRQILDDEIERICLELSGDEGR